MQAAELIVTVNGTLNGVLPPLVITCGAQQRGLTACAGAQAARAWCGLAPDSGLLDFGLLGERLALQGAPHLAQQLCITTHKHGCWQTCRHSHTGNASGRAGASSYKGPPPSTMQAHMPDKHSAEAGWAAAQGCAPG